MTGQKNARLEHLENQGPLQMLGIRFPFQPEPRQRRGFAQDQDGRTMRGDGRKLAHKPRPWSFSLFIEQEKLGHFSATWATKTRADKG